MDAATIKVSGFTTSYERLPVKGDPLKDKVDEKGYLIDDNGRRRMEMQEVDWVTFYPVHSPMNAHTTERVKHLQPTADMLHSEPTEKVKFMAARWAQIEPAYLAFKAGHELPQFGTPLGQWPGITPQAAEILRQAGIKTVEEVRDLPEAALDRVRLPGVRELRRSAKTFLENRGAAEAAAREVELDAEIAALRAQLAETNERFSAAMDLLEAQTSPQGEVEAVRAKLDELGIKYHHKAGLETLRALLPEAA